MMPARPSCYLDAAIAAALPFNSAIRRKKDRIRGRCRALICACSLVVLTPASAVELPFRGSDLKAGERFETFTHSGSGGPGEQAEGKDVIVARHTGFNLWDRLKENKKDAKVNDKKDAKVNANHLAYEKPVYAMAPGRVIECWRNAPENPPPGRHNKYKLGRIPGAGNHVVILQDDGREAHYAHFKPGTVPQSLCPHNGMYVNPRTDASGNEERDDETGYILPGTDQPLVTAGARVATGQKLGEIGNSGNSYGPHLHVHIQYVNGKPSVMRFSRGMTTPFTNSTASLDGPWKRLAGGALPLGPILIWPPRPVGYTVWNGIGASAFQRTFDHFVDSGMMPDTIGCRNNGQTYDSTWVPTQGTFIAHHRMTVSDFANKKAEYQGQGWRVVSQHQCGTVVAAVWRK